MRNTADVTGGKPIAVVCSQSISGVSAVNPVVAFYNIQKSKMLFFWTTPHVNVFKLKKIRTFYRLAGKKFFKESVIIIHTYIHTTHAKGQQRHLGCSSETSTFYQKDLVIQYCRLDRW
jgi:hypothetical protein